MDNPETKIALGARQTLLKYDKHGKNGSNCMFAFCFTLYPLPGIILDEI